MIKIILNKKKKLKFDCDRGRALKIVCNMLQTGIGIGIHTGIG